MPKTKKFQELVNKMSPENKEKIVAGTDLNGYVQSDIPLDIMVW